MMNVNTLQGPYIATGSQGGHASLQNMARNSLIRHYLPTRPYREHMRQDGIRARCNLGFPQTGMKEDFVIARSLQRGWRHCMYVILGERGRGSCSNPFTAAAQIDERRGDV